MYSGIQMIISHGKSCYINMFKLLLMLEIQSMLHYPQQVLDQSINYIIGCRHIQNAYVYL